MSKWTHLNASIRFEGLPGIDKQPNLGICYHPTPFNEILSKESEERGKRKLCDVPCGSEGSIHHNLWINPECSTAMFVATIWGDLRDYEDMGEIRSYLSRIVQGYEIISGIAEIETHDALVVLHFSGGVWREFVPKTYEK